MCEILHNEGREYLEVGKEGKSRKKRRDGRRQGRMEGRKDKQKSTPVYGVLGPSWW